MYIFMELINDFVKMENRLNAIGYDIIGAAFEVRKTFGEWLLESLYEGAMEIELMSKGHKVAKQVRMPALYKGHQINNGYVADMIVDDSVIIEFKALTKMRGEEFRQIMTYMALSNIRLGYLINFGAKDFCVSTYSGERSLDKGIYRIVNRI